MIRADALAVFALALAVCAFFGPAIFGDSAVVPWNMDLWHPWAAHASPDDLLRPSRVADSARQFMVMRKIATEALQDGRVPLWNPRVYCGTPFLANYQPAVLYPPNVVLSLSGLSIADQMSAYLVFHFLAAAIGMFVLLRSFGVGTLAALLGAIAFAWGGHVGSRTGNQTMMSTAAWLPWTLAATRRWFRRSDALGWAGMAAALGMSGLAGFAQTYVLTVYLWGCVGLIEGLGRRPRWDPVRWIGWAGAGACGLALASVHLVPTLEFIQLAQDARNTPEMLASGTLHPWTLGKAVVPDLLGHPVDHNNAAHLLSVGSGFYHQTERSTAVYLGILPLLLAGGIVLEPGDRRRETAIAILIFAAGIALCFDGPLLRGLVHLPGLGFSRPDRATLLWSAGLAMLAALGADRLAGREGPGPGRISNQLALLLGGLAGGFGLLVALGAGRVLPADVVEEVGRSALTRGGLLAIAATIFSLGIVAFRAADRMRPRVFLLAAIALVAADVGLYATRMNVMQPKEALFRPVAPGTSLAFLQERLAQESPFRLFRFEPRRSQFTGALPPSTPAWYGLEDSIGFDSINLARYEELMTAIDPAIMVKRANFRGTRRPETFPSPILDLAGVRYVVAGVDRALPGLERVHVSDLAVHENRAALPRAFLVAEVRVEEDPRRLLAAMAEESFRPDLWAFSEVPIEGLGPKEGAAGGVSEDPGSCRLTSHREEEVRVEVQPTAPALLVLTDAHYPGWNVSVDGAPRPIHRVNHLFRGVVVHPGDREVVFRYRPDSFRLGAALSVAAFVVLLGGSALLRRRSVAPGEAAS